MLIKRSMKFLAALTLGIALAGCGSDGDSIDSGTGTGTGGGTDNGNNEISSLILEGTRNQLSGVLLGLGQNIQASTPSNIPLDIGGFVIALDPTLNQLLNGPDAALSGVLSGIKTIINNPSPEGFTTAAGQIQTGLSAVPPAVASLAQNLPCALGILAGQRATVCNDNSPAEQLQSFIALFNGSDNPFAGTPLAGLGSDNGSTGPTGTPIDSLLTPLLAVLGAPNSDPNLAIPGTALNSELVDQLGQGLAFVGDAIIDGYNQIPGSNQIPVAGQLIFTIGNTLADLGIVLNQLENSPGAEIGQTVQGVLINVSNLLTAPGGLLGALAAASGQPQLVSAVMVGNTQLNLGVLTLGSVLTQGLNQLDEVLLEPVLNALAPLTCSLTLFGDCNGSPEGVDALTGILTTLLGEDAGGLLSGVLDSLTGAWEDNTGMLDDLTSLVNEIPLIGDILNQLLGGGNESSGGGSTGLLDLGFLGL